MGFAADAQGFLDRFEHRVAFVSHVGGIEAAKFSAFGGKSDQFFRLGIRRWSVFERSGNADRAIFHGVAHERFHLLKLLWRRLLVVVAEKHAADLGRTHITGQVNSHALLFEPREILAEGAPVGCDLVMLVARPVGLNNGVVQGSDGASFAGDLGRNPLKDFRR